jgi:hypothetical protein
MQQPKSGRDPFSRFFPRMPDAGFYHDLHGAKMFVALGEFNC